MTSSIQYSGDYSSSGNHLPDLGPPASYGVQGNTTLDNFSYHTRGPFEGKAFTNQTLAESTSQQLKTGPQPQIKRYVQMATEKWDSWQFAFSPIQLADIETVFQKVTGHDFALDPTSAYVPPRLVSYSVENKGFNLAKYNLGAEFEKDFQMQKESAPEEMKIARDTLLMAVIRRAKIIVMTGIQNSRMFLYEYYRNHTSTLKSLNDVWFEETFWTFRLHKDPQAIYKAVADAKMIFSDAPKPVEPNMVVFARGTGHNIAFNSYEVDASKRGEAAVQANLVGGGDAVAANISGLKLYEHIPIRARNITQDESDMFSNRMFIADFHLLDRSDISLSHDEYEAEKLLTVQFMSLTNDRWDDLSPTVALRCCMKFDKDTGNLTNKIDSMLENLRMYCKDTGYELTKDLPIDPHVYRIESSFGGPKGFTDKTSGYAKIAVWGDQSENYFTNEQLFAHATFASKHVSKRIPPNTLAKIATMQEVLDGIYRYNDIDNGLLAAWSAAIALNKDNRPSHVDTMLKGNAFGFVEPPELIANANGDNVLYVQGGYVRKLVDQYVLAKNPDDDGVVVWPDNSLLPGFTTGGAALTLAHIYESGKTKGWNESLLRVCSEGMKAINMLLLPLSDLYFKGEIVNTFVNESLLPPYQTSPDMDSNTKKTIALFNAMQNRIDLPAFVRRQTGETIDIVGVTPPTGSFGADVEAILMAMGIAVPTATDKKLLQDLLAHPFARDSGFEMVSNPESAKQLFNFYSTHESGLGTLMKRSKEFKNKPSPNKFSFLWTDYIRPQSVVNMNEAASLFWTQVNVTKISMNNPRPHRMLEFTTQMIGDAMSAKKISHQPYLTSVRDASATKLATQTEWVISRLVLSPDIWRLMANRIADGRNLGAFTTAGLEAYKLPLRPFNPLNMTTPIFADILKDDTSPMPEAVKSAPAQDAFKLSRAHFGSSSSIHKNMQMMMNLDAASRNRTPTTKNTSFYSREADASFLAPPAATVKSSYTSRILQLLPELDKVVIHGADGETKNLLLDRSEWLSSRLNYIDDTIKDPLPRICATLYCFTKANRQSIENWIQRKIPPPFLCYIHIRPWIRFITTPIFFAKGGADTAILGHNYRDSSFEYDVNTRTFKLHITAWMGYVIIEEQNFFSRPHWKHERYEGGMGSSIHDDPSTFDPQGLGQMRRDGFIFDCGSNFKLNDVLKYNHPFRLYGKVTPQNIPYKLESMEALFNQHLPPFPSFFFQCRVWKWHQIRSNNVINWSSLKAWKSCKRVPELAGSGKMRWYDQNTKQFSTVWRGMGHFENFDVPLLPALRGGELMQERFKETS